jgi:hypothetical protein
MNSPSNKRRVFLAITETSPLSELWRAVTEHLGDAQAELVTVFVSDDRWRRAASLPFTREISGVSGSSENFTLQRAEQIDKDAVASAQCEIRQLAAEAELQVAFEFLRVDCAVFFQKPANLCRANPAAVPDSVGRQRGC